MPYLTPFLNYWYLWLAAVVLLVAAANGFDQTMYLYFGDFSVQMGCWQFIQGCAVFLLAVGGAYTALDYRRKKLRPRWFKAVHLAFCLAFSVLTLVYFQDLNNKRLANPAGYFGGEHRYYEDLYFPGLLFLTLFAAAQLWFVAALVRVWRRDA